MINAFASLILLGTTDTGYALDKGRLLQRNQHSSEVPEDEAFRVVFVRILKKIILNLYDMNFGDVGYSGILNQE